MNILGPTVMAEIPDHLRARPFTGFHHWFQGFKIIVISAIDEMPTKTIASGTDAQRIQLAVIGLGSQVVPRGGDHIQPDTRAVDVARTLKSSDQEGFE